MTPPQVARHFGCKPETVRAWIRSGRLKALQTPGTKRPRFKVRPEDLAEFEKSLEVQPRQPQRRKAKRQDDAFVKFY